MFAFFCARCPPSEGFAVEPYRVTPESYAEKIFRVRDSFQSFRTARAALPEIDAATYDSIRKVGPANIKSAEDIRRLLR